MMIHPLEARWWPWWPLLRARMRVQHPGIRGIRQQSLGQHSTAQHSSAQHRMAGGEVQRDMVPKPTQEAGALVQEGVIGRDNSQQPPPLRGLLGVIAGRGAR